MPEPVKEKIVITGSGGRSITLYPVESIVVAPQKIEAFYRNVNGEGILIPINTKRTITLSDWIGISEYETLRLIIATSSVFSISWYTSTDGVDFTLKESFTNFRCTAFRVRRFLLQFSFDLEFEEL